MVYSFSAVDSTGLGHTRGYIFVLQTQIYLTPLTSTRRGPRLRLRTSSRLGSSPVDVSQKQQHQRLRFGVGFCGHESLSIIIRFALILLSVLDPGALVAKPHRLHPPQTKNSPQGLFS